MKTRQILNISTLLITLVVNGLANALPLNGITTGEISDKFPVLFTPAGYVFSIWGLIYLLLIGFAIYQALPAQREDPRLNQVGYWFVLSNVLNSAWIFLWHYGYFTLTIFAMLGLLVSLIAIYQKLQIGRHSSTGWQKLLVDLPFSVYLGWISVATIANFSITLYNLGWNGFGVAPEIWTIAVLLVATLLGSLMLFLRRDYAYALVLVWAFAGITVQQAATPVVVVAASALAVLLVILLVARLVQVRRMKYQYI